jgi:hypothetical protein
MLDVRRADQGRATPVRSLIYGFYCLCKWSNDPEVSAAYVFGFCNVLNARTLVQLTDFIMRGSSWGHFGKGVYLAAMLLIGIPTTIAALGSLARYRVVFEETLDRRVSQILAGAYVATAVIATFGTLALVFAV